MGIRRDCAEPSGCAFAGTNRVHAQLVILAVLTEGCELLSCRQSETSLKPAGLRNKACQFAGLHVVSNGQIQSVKPPRGCNLGSKPSLGQRTPWPGKRAGGFLLLSTQPHSAGLGLHRSGPVRGQSSYLVDPASSHMLVSKIKPCMSKYKQVCTVKLRMAH